MSHLRAVSLMIIATLLWSMAGVVTRHLDSAPSFEVTFWRSMFNALALAVAITLLNGPNMWRRILHSPSVVWISGVCWAFMFTAFMIAITLTTVANVLITMAAGPLITALFVRLILKYKLHWTTWFAIFVAGIGIAWMFHSSVSLLGTLVGLVVPLAAAMNFTILQHVGLGSSKLVVAPAMPIHDMLPAVFIGATLSALCTLPYSLPFQASSHDLGLLLILGIFQLALPCLLVVRVSRKLPAHEISLIGLLEVIFGVTWAWLWAGEQPSANILAGGALVIGALVVNEMAKVVRQRKIKQQLFPLNNR